MAISSLFLMLWHELYDYASMSRSFNLSPSTPSFNLSASRRSLVLKDVEAGRSRLYTLDLADLLACASSLEQCHLWQTQVLSTATLQPEVKK
jgi:hypothetical protein